MHRSAEYMFLGQIGCNSTVYVLGTLLIRPWPFTKERFTLKPLFCAVDMHLIRPSVILAVACSSVVSAAPVDKCSPVDTVYAILRGPLKSQASSLCLSFLGGDKTIQQTQVRPFQFHQTGYLD
jgi:hypothetical protein